jgi:flagellar basal body rod protein FlgB
LVSKESIVDLRLLSSVSFDRSKSVWVSTSVRIEHLQRKNNNTVELESESRKLRHMRYEALTILQLLQKALTPYLSAQR